MAQVLVLGLINGGIYAIFAVGVVLVFRGTGVLTFAQGEIGTVALYFAYFLIARQHLPWLVGAAGAIVLATVIGGLFEFIFVRRMVQASVVATVVLTVGLTLLLLAIEFFWFGASPRVLPPPTKGGLHIAGVIVSATQIAALIFAIGLGFGLQALLRRTDFGLGILAAAQDPAAVRLVGVPLSRVSLTIWSAGAALSGLAALLVEPSVGSISPGYAGELFVVGLAAAVVGGLTSLPGAFVGGMVLGISESAATRYLGDYGVPGLTYIVVLTVLLAVLLARSFSPELRRWYAQVSPGTQQPAGATS